MSGQLFLDWLSLGISLFNMILLVWLGFTVLFNAENRNWGVFLAVGGLLAGAGFFLSHSIILAQGANSLIRGFGFWWQVGWFPIIAAPYAWYLLMLWYTGYWENPTSPLRQRQQAWLGLSIVYTLVLAGLLFVANPLPDISHDAYMEIERLPALGTTPLIVLAYPPYIVLCLGLALDALLRPAPSHRVLGEMARSRARPWLIGASIVLLLVSLMVGGIFVWLTQTARQTRIVADLIIAYSTTLSVLDLILAVLLMTAIFLLGQAIVAYEIFSGKTLPSMGFQRQWRSIILISCVLCLLTAWFVTVQIPQIVTVIAILVILALSYSFFSHQIVREREGNMRKLRPFVIRQRLFESVLTQSPQAEVDLAEPFGALCREVIGVRQAALEPMGALAALGMPALHYPPGRGGQNTCRSGLAAQFTSPEMKGAPLDSALNEGMVWVAPLWNESGMVGLLFLGEKTDNGIYSLEEIEIARSSAERLADIFASAEMARRFISLQRKRLLESGILDQQARRTLHDDILPRLHTAMLQAGGQAESCAPAFQEALENLSSVHRQISDLLRDLPKIFFPDLERYGFIEALRRVVSHELTNNFDEVIWQMDPDASQSIQQLPIMASEVLYYAVREAMRNSARHARADYTQPLRLIITLEWDQGLKIYVEDNGVGISQSKKDEAGSGQGLALHSAMMAIINGSLSLESTPGEYTRVTLFLPEQT
jgi:signal transduction histidine kinase